MKTIEEFEEYYNHTLKNELSEAENLRKTSITSINNATFIFAVLFTPLLVLLIFLFGENHIKHIIPFLIIVILIWLLFYYRIKRQYLYTFKNKVLTKILNSIDPNLAFYPNHFIPKHQFMNSCMFQSEPNSYFGKNLISGTIDGKYFQMSEIVAERQLEEKIGYTGVIPNDANPLSITNGIQMTNVKLNFDLPLNIFEGLFLVIDLNKLFKCDVLILNDPYEKKLGYIADSLHAKKPYYTLIKLEDLEFEQEFVVYGTDQIMTRYILTTNLMQKIVNFKKKFNKKICMSFIGSKVYLAIENIFFDLAPDINSTLQDFNAVSGYYELVSFVNQLVEELELNINIHN